MERNSFSMTVEYGAVAAIAGRLLKSELITVEEYRKLTAVLAQKYRQLIGSKQITCSNSTPKNYMDEKTKGGMV